jgi:hypothetical protein
MRRTYKALTRSLPIFALVIVIGAILGIFTFSHDYNANSGWINLSYLSVSFGIIVAIAFFFAIVTGIFAKNAKVIRFRDNHNLSRFSSVLLTIITFSLFLLEFYKLVLLSGIGFWRTIRMFLTLGASINFLFIALHRKFVSKHFSKKIRITFSIVTVFWAITSVFSVYFAQNSVALSNIIKVILLLSYLSVTVFMLLEAKFKHVKPMHIAYTASALICAIFGCVFCFPIAIAIGVGKLEVDFTVMEFTVCFVIGIYAITRICAMIATILFSIKTHSENSTPRELLSVKSEPKSGEITVVESTTKEDSKVEAAKDEPVQKKSSQSNHKAKYSQYPKSKKSGAKKSPAKRKK